MTKKKKMKEENVEEKGYVIELKGILLVLISIIGLCPFGPVSQFIKGFSSFLVGSIWAILLLAIGIIGIYTIIKRKYPKLFNGKTVGIFVIILGVLILLHKSYMKIDGIDPNHFNIGKDLWTVLKTTVDNIMRFIKDNKLLI